jgi:hypothetical protein
MDNFSKMFGGTMGLLIAIVVVCCVVPTVLALLNAAISGGR